LGPKLKTRITRKKRDRLADLEFREAIIDGRKIAPDPGLREAFPALPRLPLRLICCRLTKLINHGGLLRLAENFRLDSVHFEAPPDGIPDLSGAQGAGEWIKWTWGDPLEAIKEAKAEGYQIVGLTLNERAQAIQTIEWQHPCALVLGEEKFGLTPTIEDACDVCAAIPLYGMIASLNVTHAAVIGVYEASRSYQRGHPEFLPARSASRNLVQP
jgi:tRNA (guanosine-2'-O-)-methyltransferase